MQGRKSRGGRPRREPDPGERVKLGLRVTPQLKGRLDESADQNGRSQSQEAEFLLERALDRADLLGEVLTLAFDKRTAGFLIAMGLAMERAAQTTLLLTHHQVDEDWVSNPDAYHAARSAAELLFQVGRPEGKWSTGYETGLSCASQLIGALSHPDGEYSILGDPLPHSETLLRLLGPVVDRMKDELPRWQADARKTREILERFKEDDKKLPELKEKMRRAVARSSGKERDALFGGIARIAVREANEACQLVEPQDRDALVQYLMLQLESLTSATTAKKRA